MSRSTTYSTNERILVSVLNELTYAEMTGIAEGIAEAIAETFTVAEALSRFARGWAEAIEESDQEAKAAEQT